MALLARIAFDVSLPVVAAQAFPACDREFAPGDPIDWRALGVAEAMLYNWWRCGLVAFHPAPAVESERAPDAPKPKRKVG